MTATATTARERYEALYAEYNDGTYCIGRDAWWPADLASAYREACEEAGREATTLTRAEAAYAHLASFQRGDVVDVGGRSFFQPGTVTTAQQHGRSGINRAYLIVTGCGVETRVTVGSLLSGKHTVTSLADAKAGNVRHFDAATWAMQNQD